MPDNAWRAAWTSVQHPLGQVVDDLGWSAAAEGQPLECSARMGTRSPLRWIAGTSEPALKRRCPECERSTTFEVPSHPKLNTLISPAGHACAIHAVAECRLRGPVWSPAPCVNAPRCRVPAPLREQRVATLKRFASTPHSRRWPTTAALWGRVRLRQSSAPAVGSRMGQAPLARQSRESQGGFSLELPVAWKCLSAVVRPVAVHCPCVVTCAWRDGTPQRHLFRPVVTPCACAPVWCHPVVHVAHVPGQYSVSREPRAPGVQLLLHPVESSASRLDVGAESHGSDGTQGRPAQHAAANPGASPPLAAVAGSTMPGHTPSRAAWSSGLQQPCGIRRRAMTGGYAVP